MARVELSLNHRCNCTGVDVHSSLATYTISAVQAQYCAHSAPGSILKVAKALAIMVLLGQPGWLECCALIAAFYAWAALSVAFELS